jgi:amino acid transporter
MDRVPEPSAGLKEAEGDMERDLTSLGPIAEASTAPPDGASRELSRNSVGATQVAITAFAAAGPAASLFFILPVMAATVGSALMFAMAVAFAVILVMNNTFVEFSKRISSAGGLFAWASASLGSNVGFLFGWFFAGCYLLIVAQVFATSGGLIHDYLTANLSIDIPWWVLSLVAAAYIVTFAWRGIRISVKTAMALLVFEVTVMLALALWLLISGDASLHLSVFDPGQASGGASAIGLAIAFGVLLVINYEAAATLGEEAQDAERSVTRGLWFAVIASALFFLFISWVLISSYGAPIDEFAKDGAAVQTIATHEWHGLGSIVTIVVFSSIVAVGQGAFMGATRVLYSLGRLGVVPSTFARTHPVHRTPSAAIIVMTILGLAIGLPVGFAVGSIPSFAYWGLMISIGFLVVYILINVGLFKYIREHHPSEFSPVRHVVLPAVAIVGLGYTFYRTIHPLPPGGLSITPFVVLAWAVIGLGILVYLRATKSADVDEVGRVFTGE